MAKALKIGDAVSVQKDLRLPRADPAYQAGLKTLKPSMVGRIVKQAEGRSVIVEFDGKQVMLSSQRLKKVEAPGEKKRGRRKSQPVEQAPSAEPTPEPNPPSTSSGLLDYHAPRFLTAAANALIRQGADQADSESVIVQVKLSDLPDAVRDQIQRLIQAKLDLTPQAGASAPTEPKQPGRRGRKPGKK